MFMQWVDFLPEIFLLMLDVVDEMYETEFWPDAYDYIYQLSYEQYAAEYVTIFVSVHIYRIFDPEEGGLPLVYNLVELAYEDGIPTDMRTKRFQFLETFGWWFKFWAIVIKEYARPFLKFDELSLVKVSSWNFGVNLF